MPATWKARLGALIAQRRGSMSQAVLADLISEAADRKVPSYLISELERGKRWDTNDDLISAFESVLNISPSEMHEVIAGRPAVEPEPSRGPRSFAEIVAQDTTLSEAAREHLLNQYELLQMATMHQRRGEPVLHQDKASRRRKRA